MIPEDLEECQRLLDCLKKEAQIFRFEKPVIELHPEIKQIYLKQISQPMDMRTISVFSLILKEKENIKNRIYKERKEFYDDVRLMFTNSMMITFEKDFLHRIAKNFLNIFENLWSESFLSLQNTMEGIFPKKRRRSKIEMESKKQKITSEDFILTSIYDSLPSPKMTKEIQPKGLLKELYRYQMVKLIRIEI
jgi:hypothetical protein